ncbi:hypothetical protein SynRS9902_01472 [Synechococcus sp. RS9902]|nr:hypothetical protein SynRS9902_01472 [Synechococcus sp. RS9902]
MADRRYCATVSSKIKLSALKFFVELFVLCPNHNCVQDNSP